MKTIFAISLAAVLFLPGTADARTFRHHRHFPVARFILRVAAAPVRLVARATFRILRAEARIIIFIFRPRPPIFFIPDRPRYSEEGVIQSDRTSEQFFEVDQ